MTLSWPSGGPLLHGPLLKGLYLITPDEADTACLLARVQPVLGDAVLLQYRNKHAGGALKREQIAALLPLCREHGIGLVVNDSALLARECGADGVHLGEHDGDPRHARELLGARAIVGVSCHDDLARAQLAIAAGASYVAFGAFHPSPTKPNARRPDLSLLRDAASLQVPRVAIGGITPDNARPLIAAGADLIAVISGVFDAPDPVVAARAYRRCFTHPDSTPLPPAGGGVNESRP